VHIARGRNIAKPYPHHIMGTKRPLDLSTLATTAAYTALVAAGDAEGVVEGVDVSTGPGSSVGADDAERLRRRFLNHLRAQNLATTERLCLVTKADVEATWRDANVDRILHSVQSAYTKLEKVAAQVAAQSPSATAFTLGFPSGTERLDGIFSFSMARSDIWKYFIFLIKMLSKNPTNSVTLRGDIPLIIHPGTLATETRSERIQRAWDLVGSLLRYNSASLSISQEGGRLRVSLRLREGSLAEVLAEERVRVIERACMVLGLAHSTLALKLRQMPIQSA